MHDKSIKIGHTPREILRQVGGHNPVYPSFGARMAVYVDELVDYPGKGRWCHMVSNDPEELHAMAARIGLRREWFQSRARHPHYDLMAFSRALAVQHGAIEVSLRELVRILKQ